MLEPRKSQAIRYLLGPLVLCLLAARLPAAAAEDIEREPISYSATIPQNAVSNLKTELELGRTHFEFDVRTGYLRSLLRSLGVPPSSQMLVFSKTSFQRQRIAPKTPRAVYFNDD
ncbi:MAG TPA: hypothetical protein VHX68_20805, partial [Planctomycetaceae bacterium]|nr:hypothetical protein [Planctomycetaceae bacterium]